MALIIPSKKTTRMEQPVQKILELLAGSGGELQIPLMADEANKLSVQFDEKYWASHCPWGVPGDQIWIAEPYKVIRECKEASGYTITVEYEDESTKAFTSKTPTSISKTTEPATRMPIGLCRCVLLIDDVSYDTTSGSWLITTELVEDSTD